MSGGFKSHRDLVEWIANDPQLVAEREARALADPRIVEGRRLYAEAAAELLPQLQVLVPQFTELGFTITTVNDLYSHSIFVKDAAGAVIERRKIDYRPALPLLAEWLPKATYYPFAHELGVALRPAMARKYAVPVFLELIRNPSPVDDPRPESWDADHWRQMMIDDLCFGLADHANPAIADEIIELAQDTSLGLMARMPLIGTGLAKIKDPRAPGLLLELLSDPEPRIVMNAMRALGRLRYTPARPRVEAFLETKGDLQSVARQVLKRL